MVSDYATSTHALLFFQYSLCRVVLMVHGRSGGGRPCCSLSVLALSSRFDGLTTAWTGILAVFLSVLALSSRFDGQKRAGILPDFHRLSVLALSSRFDGR